MKEIKIITVLATLIVFSLSIHKNQNANLKEGDLAFMGFNASKVDGFEIICLENIKPNTTIYFTDSEWNGSHFGADESNLIWNSGNHLIKSGTKITFESINKNPIVNYGSIKNILKISKNGDAIFAYLGSAPKLPTIFLAAMANNTNSYGTLINTGLIEGKTAITYPNGTYSAQFKQTINKDRISFYEDLNIMNNYSFNFDKNNSIQWLADRN